MKIKVLHHTKTFCGTCGEHSEGILYFLRLTTDLGNILLMLQGRIWKFVEGISFNQITRGGWGFPGGTSGKEPACQCRRRETGVQSLGQEDPLEKKMATHSSVLAWKIPWTEKPGGGIQFIGSQSQTHD